VDQNYPVDRLEFIIVDDGSSDNSVEVIKKTVEDLKREGPQYDIENRVRVFFQKYNQGKREAMAIGIRNCRTELIVFVDSDSFLQPNAIRCLVQPMRDPKTAGVAGRTEVANISTNHLTKMQAVRYYISFRVMKAAEAYFDSVMCLSGPLSCYRITAVREVFDKWINQKFLGQKATFGDDRSLTNYVVEHHRTYYQDTAICSTIVPNRHRQFLRQQMRWKRSWLRESLRAGRFIWRKQPFMSFFFYLGLLVPLIAPIIVLYNVVYIPLVRGIFPTTFLLGLLMMSLMMCFAQLILKKSTLWIYGLLFCLYYEFFLLWQMPWAWVTFWVNDWGTRGKGKKRAAKADKGQKESSAQAGVMTNG
jgi:hyaluronan synthase